jgi:hypothetical protein
MQNNCKPWFTPRYGPSPTGKIQPLKPFVLNHKMGEIPNYLKKMRMSSETNISISEENTNKLNKIIDI